MFSLIKMLLTVGILLAVVTVGLGFFAPSPEQQKELGGQLAGMAIKGCRGGKVLFRSLVKELREELNVERDAVDTPAELADAGGAVEAAPQPAH
jgi:hypothetical protein